MTSVSKHILTCTQTVLWFIPAQVVYNTCRLYGMQVHFRAFNEMQGANLTADQRLWHRLTAQTLKVWSVNACHSRNMSLLGICTGILLDCHSEWHPQSSQRLHINADCLLNHSSHLVDKYIQGVCSP